MKLLSIKCEMFGDWQYIIIGANGPDIIEEKNK